MHKTADNRAWLLILPVFLLVAFNAVLPLMTVVNYSLQDIFGPGQRAFIGVEWFRETLRDPAIQPPSCGSSCFPAWCSRSRSPGSPSR